MSDNFSLFDPDKARGPRKGPDVGKDVTSDLLGSKDQSTPVGVSVLVSQIKAALSQAFPRRVSVVGEISNFKRHGSGHLYFRLKDAQASIDVAMFRPAASKLKFSPTDGLEVVIDGRIDVYDVRGQLQLYSERMTPKGAGALELAFRQLKDKLESEGLFDPQIKKPIPRFPRAIAVVTSPTGAAIRDIRRTLARRWPAATVYLVGVLVQGEGAAEQIAQAVTLLDASAEDYQIDTIIVARGGGSIEDLWAFNEEPVALAIYAAETPVISGVGHEVDVTIADMVADLRAPTPTGAAELAVPDGDEVSAQISQLNARLSRRAGDQLARARAAIEAIGRSVVFKDPSAGLRTQTQRIDELGYKLRASVRERLSSARSALSEPANRLAALHPATLAERAAARLDRARSSLAWVLRGRTKRSAGQLSELSSKLAEAHPRHRLKMARQKVASLGRQMEAMSYRSVLARGFSVTRLAGGDILRSIQQVRPGLKVRTELSDGRFDSLVEGGSDAKQRNSRTKADKPRSASQGGLFDD